MKSEMVYIISGGGDGTTSWVLKVLIENKVELQKCTMIPFPFGTGNDFSNSLGWGINVPKSISTNSFAYLQQSLEHWKRDGEVVEFDIWDIVLTTVVNICT